MSADPNVTSVGGTQFSPKFANGNAQGYAIESAWNDGSGAGGGGASQVFAKPDYQTGPGVPNDGARDVPDISLMASPNAPGAFFGHDVDGTPKVVCCVGGTSLSAPLWAGFSRVLAEVVGNTRLGNLNPIIYQLANQQYATAGFHDVTNGNNGYNGLPGFNAAAGYDQSTGWGTVDFEVFGDAVWKLFNPGAERSPTATATPTSVPSPTPSAQPTGGVLSVPLAVNFPATATGRPGTMKTLTIRNLSRTTALSIELGVLTAPFAVSGAGHRSIAPASSIQVAILFSPASSGTFSQSIEITSSDPKHRNVAVRVAVTVRGGKLSLPANVAFTSKLSAIATRTVMLKNSGPGLLSGSTESFGSNSAFIVVGGPITFWLTAGQTQPLTIQYRPATVGTVRENLMIAIAEPAGVASMKVSGSMR